MIKWSKKVKLPADLFSRNTFLALLIEQLLKEDLISQKKIRVLDVGGFGSKLAWFLPKEIEVTIFDQKPKPTEGHTQYVQGDLRQLPFEDNSFDLVLSSDTLPLLAQNEHENFLHEIGRVSKRYIIIASPFQNIINEKAQEYLFSQYKEITGENHPLFTSNEGKTLPELEEIENYFFQKKYSYFKVGEGNIYNRYLFQLIENSHLIFAEDSLEYSSKFNHFFNQNLTELGNFRTPTYRTVLCIDKEKVLNKHEFIELIEEKNNFHSSIYFEALKTAFDDLNGIMKALQKLREERSELASEKDNLTKNPETSFESQFKMIIDKQEQELRLQDAQLNELRALLTEKEEESQEKNKVINSQQVELEQKSQALLFLTNQIGLLEKQITSQENFLAKLGTELELKNKEIEGLKNIVIQKEHNVRQRIQEIRQKNLQIQEIQAELTKNKENLSKIENSFLGRILKIYAQLKKKLYRNSFQSKARFGRILTNFGSKASLKKKMQTLSSTSQQSFEGKYQQYVERTSSNPSALKEMQRKILTLEYKPLMSIILDLRNIQEEHLCKILDSLRAQIYPKWELSIIHYASNSDHLKSLIGEYCQKDSRIKAVFSVNSTTPSKTLNKALKASQGAYMTFIGEGELSPYALAETVKVLQEKKYDLLYTDEDELEKDRKRSKPYFKPELGLDFLLNGKGIGNLVFYRRKLIEEIGGFRDGLEGSEHYDLLLRFTEKYHSTYHIAQILYHSYKEGKVGSVESIKKAIKDTLRNRKIKGEIIEENPKQFIRLKRSIEGEPMVSILIPFKDQVDVLKACLNSIFEKTSYNNYEIILINNASELLESIEYVKDVENCPRVRLIHYNGPFNYSAMCNLAAQQAAGEYLLLLKSESEVVEPQWIENMLEHAQREEVGAVGAKILFPDREKIQHAGIIVGFGNMEIYPSQTKEENIYKDFAQIIRNVSAVTADCLMIRKKLYEKIDGLDEENLATSFYDVDLCLRLREAGYSIVYTPYAVLCKQQDANDEVGEGESNEKSYISRRHQIILEKGDPYYKVNLWQWLENTR